MPAALRTFALFLVLAAAGASIASSAPFDVRERGAIVPLVDHHQHIVGPRATIPWPALAPVPALPSALKRVVDERNRIMGTADLGDLYTVGARILDTSEEAQPWALGREALAARVQAHDSTTRFVPQSFSMGDSVAQILGIAETPGTPVTRMHFVLGLKKDARGAWRIDSEQATPVPPPPFAAPLDGDHLVRDLDETGIGRAVVLSVAYFFASPNRTWPGDELENVRAETDWVAAQVAKHPDRLVMFCGVSPIKDYAVDEIRRCAREHKVKGVKIHLRSSRVDVMNPEHLARVKRVFQVANELGLAIVVHTAVRGYSRAHAEVFLEELLPAAPDVVVQVAHLWGGNEFAPEALAVFADAVAAKDSRARNLYFDLTEAQFAAGDSKETWAEIARRLRQIGLDRVFYGSDAAATPDSPPTALRWARMRRDLPLSNDELKDIADNVAPYLR